jgi:hypothetical protein
VEVLCAVTRSSRIGMRSSDQRSAASFQNCGDWECCRSTAIEIIGDSRRRARSPGKQAWSRGSRRARPQGPGRSFLFDLRRGRLDGGCLGHLRRIPARERRCAGYQVRTPLFVVPGGPYSSPPSSISLTSCLTFSVLEQAVRGRACRARQACCEI